MQNIVSDQDEPVRLTARVVVLSIVGLWLCYFVLITVRGSIVGLDMQTEMLWRRAIVAVAGIVITCGLWQVIRLIENRGMLAKVMVVLIASLPAALLIAQINHTMFAPLEEKFMREAGEKQGANVYRDEAGNLLIDVPAWQAREFPESDEQEAEGAGDADRPQTPSATFVLAPASDGFDHWRQVTDIALGRYFLLLAWASLYLAMVAGAEARDAQRRGERFRSAAKAAELRSLRYQVNPHFLFNALNSLSALVMTGKEERAEEMIQTISRFYRHSLADDPTGDVSLDDEIDLQEHYLEIESVRFPERLRVTIACPRELGGYQVPGMILQPLVENSVKYGVSASTEPVTITIAAREEYGRLVLTVSDDGPGGKAGSDTPNGGFGIGLANVRDRLIARFGKEASITSGPILDGYETELRLPMVKHG
ncbi:sensor histidine kinase [Qipengyuania sp. DGS5-3]|uniref:sensor histidine kinase n=1 Tax=Qipengyuania sp. DGS5-3 TaxID=3349632 RepID=UPI0036D29379